jgi:DNA-binding response OmpR family regulator
MLGRKMPVVFVVSRDWTLRAAVRAELREAGVDALGLETAEDVGKDLARGVLPAVVVVDAAELDTPLARESLGNLARTVPVLVIDSRTAAAPDLPGAERLPRPLRVGDIIARVLARLAGRPV